MLLASLIGAAVASAAIVLLGTDPGSSRSSALARTASVPAGAAAGTRREASLSAPTASQIYRQASPGVVAIKAVTANGADEGTGIVLNNEGLILTNDHVVARASSLSVDASGASKATRAATLVGEEANDDLALIRVDPSGLGLKPLALASSGTVQVGAAVYAIGNPYGLEETLTRGIVSALNREISAPDGATITGAIQTDAALNPGNSGGPLLNEQGQVIGVNSQIASDAGSGTGSQPGSTGVGFAISTNTVAQAVMVIQEGKGVSYASGAHARLASQGGYGEQASPYGGGSPERSRSPYREAEASEEAGTPGEGGEALVVP
jgi:putative serine protease PepD